MTLPHTISLYGRAQGDSGGFKLSPVDGEATDVQASVQPLRPQETYDALGVESVQGVKVFLAPDTVVPANAAFDFGGSTYVVEGTPESHRYGSPNDHLKLYARSPV